MQAVQNYQKCTAHKASLQKLHEFNFKTPIFASLSSILNSLILSKSIKAGLKQPEEGGTGFQCLSSPHEITKSRKF